MARREVDLGEIFRAGNGSRRATRKMDWHGLPLLALPFPLCQLIYVCVKCWA